MLRVAKLAKQKITWKVIEQQTASLIDSFHLKILIQKDKKLENDIFSVSDTGILGKRNSEFSEQESNLRPSD